jgi:hypothetical protein
MPMKKTGNSKSRTYRIWKAMKSRCKNPNVENYKNYGGRGVTVCNRWALSFEDFLSDMGHAPEGMSIDRKNGFGNYERENCKWSTRKEQANNKRDNTFIEHDGLRLTVAQWSDRTGISQGAILFRIKSKWGINDILNTPSNRGNRLKLRLTTDQLKDQSP